jgi:hypothetical protein
LKNSRQLERIPYHRIADQIHALAFFRNAYGNQNGNDLYFSSHAHPEIYAINEKVFDTLLG